MCSKLFLNCDCSSVSHTVNEETGGIFHQCPCGAVQTFGQVCGDICPDCPPCHHAKTTIEKAPEEISILRRDVGDLNKRQIREALDSICRILEAVAAQEGEELTA